ncbi:hypothetical protein [Oricola sp.]|uniref:hypothetical protein n=1 Tax=Oricola sp. TaxID=1979950 RepID=UPI003BAA1630
MRVVLRFVFLLFRWLCYAALAYVVAGFGSLILLSLMDVCPRLDTGAIECVSETYTSIAKFGMGAALISVFTGLPLLLALLGLFFLLRWLVKTLSKSG